MRSRRLITLLLFFSGLRPVVAQDPVEEFFAARGPLPTVSEPSTGPDGEFSLFRPAEPGAGGALHPVITWGNGTLAVPERYAGFLDHLASHGFVVIASRSRFTGSGRQMLDGVDFVLDEAGRSGSPLFQAIDVDAIGAAGHSQGGAGTINAGNDPRILCTAAIQPVPGNVDGLQGPMFVMAGSEDRLVSPRWVARSVVLPPTVETVFGVLRGAGHLDALGDADGFRGYVTAWFSYCLAGDETAAQVFTEPCTLCENPGWRVFRKPGRQR